MSSHLHICGTSQVLYVVTQPSLSPCLASIPGNAECVGRAVWHSPRPGHSHGKMFVPIARTPGQKDRALNLGSSRKLSSKAGSGLGKRWGSQQRSLDLHHSIYTMMLFPDQAEACFPHCQSRERFHRRLTRMFADLYRNKFKRPLALS